MGRPGYGRVEVPGPGHGPPVVAHVEDDVVVDDVALWPKPPIVFPHQGVKGDSQAKGYHQTNRTERDYPANTIFANFIRHSRSFFYDFLVILTELID